MDTRTQRYRYNPEPPHLQSLFGFENIEFRTFDSPDHVPAGEGWVSHPDWAKKPQIESVAAKSEPVGTEVATEILAAGEAIAPRRRGRPPKGA